MSDPAIWIEWHAEGGHTLFRIEPIVSGRAVKYLPATEQPPIALASGEPCTVITTSYYERLLADAEKWERVEKVIKELGIVT